MQRANLEMPLSLVGSARAGGSKKQFPQEFASREQEAGVQTDNEQFSLACAVNFHSG